MTRRMDRCCDYSADVDVVDGECTIGGIPSRFLDLSHFPLLRKSIRAGGGIGTNAPHRRHGFFLSPEEEEEEEDGGDGRRRTAANGKKRHHPLNACTKEEEDDDNYDNDVP